MRRVLLLSGNEALGLKVVYCLHAGGYEVDVMSLVPANSIRHSRYRSRFHHVPREEVADWINRRASRLRWDAVLADDVKTHGFLHSISQGLDVPAFAPSPASLLAECHDKWSFYRRLREAGLPAPPSILLKDARSLNRTIVARLGFPLLTKPLNEESGNGIRRFDHFAELAEYLHSPGPYKSYPLKLQRFVPAHTVGLSFLAEQGEIVTHDVQLHEECGSRFFYPDPEVLELGRRIVKLFGYGGPGHIDFVRDVRSGELFALEFNCRFWFSVTVSAWRGGNFPVLAARLARQGAVPFAPTAVGRYFQTGRVVRLLRKPHWLLRLDGANWRGFWQAVSDPAPHLGQNLH